MLDKEYIYLIGIGGIGMSALARYFHGIGKKVAGYDRVQSNNCKMLEKEGIDIHYDDQLSSVASPFLNKEQTTIIYTPAIPQDNIVFNHFKDQGFDLLKRARVLGEIAKNHRCLAVAGTHGKTTTSALLAHLFHNAGIKVTAFLGGIASNYQTNFLAAENSDILVAEADEYDRSFLQLKPTGAIITSIDADHLDIYDGVEDLKNTFSAFAECITDHRIIQNDVPIPGESYGLENEADYYAENIRIENHNYVFDLISPNHSIKNISSGLPGRHNVENAVGAAALALNYGLKPLEVKEGLETFRGVKRRFEYQIKTDNLIYLDDYAHHPSEITAFLNSVRELYPEKRIIGVFQPHLFSRTKDFADAFAESLSILDELILLEIYPAREKPITGINAQMILDKVQNTEKSILSKDQVIPYIARQELEVLVTIGAGDIDQLVAPIKSALLRE